MRLLHPSASAESTSAWWFRGHALAGARNPGTPPWSGRTIIRMKEFENPR